MPTILGSLRDASANHAWLTIGSFDGVHVGHQYLIKKLVDGAHAVGAPAVVLTFHPHPVVVLRGKTGDIYLTLPEERANILLDMGVDTVIIEPFTRELSQTSAREFVEQLVLRLGLDHLLVGHDFALGRGREGNFEVLSQLGFEYGFKVEEVEAVRSDGEIISSSLIRLLLEAGDVSRAGQWLGRPYRVRGEVIHGDSRGRILGFPTANLSVVPGKILPAIGIYACQAWIEGQAWGAATSFGVRPTFDGQGTMLHLEAHLLDYSGDLYGQTISLDFIERLRGEVRFPDAQALIAQIDQDVQQTRRLLSQRKVKILE
jgi:riboflavin kinase / FMN adenylyltransferase